MNSNQILRYIEIKYRHNVFRAAFHAWCLGLLFSIGTFCGGYVVGKNIGYDIGYKESIKNFDVMQVNRVLQMEAIYEELEEFMAWRNQYKKVSSGN